MLSPRLVTMLAFATAAGLFVASCGSSSSGSPVDGLGCLTEAGRCPASCTAPTCTDGSASDGPGGHDATSDTAGPDTGAGGTDGASLGSACTDLMKCCASASVVIKAACNTQYDTLKAQPDKDAVCTTLAQQYRSQGYCTY
jgi:hypothetical protein